MLLAFQFTLGLRSHRANRFLALYTTRAVSRLKMAVWKLDASRMPFLRSSPAKTEKGLVALGDGG